MSSHRYPPYDRSYEVVPYERWVLTLVLFVVIIFYAALGRDVFFNKLDGPNAPDPIGAVLPYLRLLICGLAFVIAVGFSGLEVVQGEIPLVFMPFVGFVIASAAWSSDPMVTIRAGAGLVALWVAVPVVVHRIGLEAAARVIVLTVSIVLIASLALAILLPSIGRHTGLEIVQSSHVGRWRGIFSHKNSLGAWAGLGSVVLFTHGAYGFRSFTLRWLARVGAVACLVMAQSVTAIATAAALLMFWMALRVMRHTSFAAAVCFAIFLAGVAAAILMLGGDVVLDILGRDTTLSGRSLVWSVAYHYIDTQPWLGSGYSTSGGPDFLSTLADVFGQALPGPESGYLLMLLEVGAVGCVLFVIPFLIALRSGIHQLLHKPGRERPAIELMVMILSGTLVTSLTEGRSFVTFGADGVLNYIALFSLLPSRGHSIMSRHWATSTPVTLAAPPHAPNPSSLEYPA